MRSGARGYLVVGQHWLAAPTSVPALDTVSRQEAPRLEPAGAFSLLPTPRGAPTTAPGASLGPPRPMKAPATLRAAHPCADVKSARRARMPRTQRTDQGDQSRAATSTRWAEAPCACASSVTAGPWTWSPAA